MSIRLIEMEAESLFLSPARHGDAITDKRAGHANYSEPKIAYLMYFSFAAPFQQVVIHAKCAITTTREDAELQLLKSIKSNPQGSEVLPVHPNDTIVWNYPNHLTLVLDIPGLNWAYDIANQKYPIDFFSDKDGKTYHENFSFYDAVEAKVDGLPAIRLTNYLKGDAAGTDLKTPADRRQYCMVFNFLFPTGRLPEPWSWDPDSENQGPGGLVPPA